MLKSDEREEWEALGARLEAQVLQLGTEKAEAEKTVITLAQEIRELRRALAEKAPVSPGTMTPGELSETLRVHHEQQLVLMATIDDLRGKTNLAEQEKCQTSHVEVNALKQKVDLEEENLRLREEINALKQKVSELKQAVQSQKVASKEEVEKNTVELKEKLEAEVVRLRLEMVNLRRDLSTALEREGALRRKAAEMERIVQEVQVDHKEKQRRTACRTEEMEIINATVGAQLVNVEQELTTRIRKTTELFELFLLRALQPLTVVRNSCRGLAASGKAGESMWRRPVPELFTTDSRDIQGSFVKIVELLRYAAEVHNDFSQQQSCVRQEQDDVQLSTVDWLKSTLLLT